MLVIVVECNRLLVNEMTLIDQLREALYLGCAFFIISKKGPYQTLVKQIIAMDNRLI